MSEPKRFNEDDPTYKPASFGDPFAIIIFDAAKEEDANHVLLLPCPECDGTGKVQEYQSRSDYMENGAADPVTCGECKGTGWVREEWDG